MDYARDTRTGKIVAAEGASRSRFYVCPRPGCGGRVYLPHVSYQRPHFRHFPGEGTDACDLYFPGTSLGGTHDAPVCIELAVEEDPAELGLIIAQVDGRWGISLRLPEIPSDELGETSLNVLRAAFVDVYAGSDFLLRTSALDLRPGVGVARVDVVPSLQAFRTEPAGTWPSTIDSERWNLESRGIDPKGTLFRIRRGEWMRLREGSGVHHGEALLVLADARCAPPPANLVAACHAELISRGLKWTIKEVRLPDNDIPNVTAWLAQLGHQFVTRPWAVKLAAPPRTRTEGGDPVFWIGDSPVLTVEGPWHGAEALASLKTGSNTHQANVTMSERGVAYVCIASQHIGTSRFTVAGEQNATIELVFVERPMRSSTLDTLALTPRLRVCVGDQVFEAWQRSTHKVCVASRELPDVRITLGARSARAQVTVRECGKERSRGGLDSQNAEKAVRTALSTASRIDIEAENLGRVVLVPVFADAHVPPAPLAGERLAWRDYVVSSSRHPMEPTMPALLEQPRTGRLLTTRRVDAAMLVRTRIGLRRCRRFAGNRR